MLHFSVRRDACRCLWTKHVAENRSRSVHPPFLKNLTTLNAQVKSWWSYRHIFQASTSRRHMGVTSRKLSVSKLRRWRWNERSKTITQQDNLLSSQRDDATFCLPRTLLIRPGRGLILKIDKSSRYRWIYFARAQNCVLAESSTNTISNGWKRKGETSVGLNSSFAERHMEVTRGMRIDQVLFPRRGVSGSRLKRRSICLARYGVKSLKLNEEIPSSGNKLARWASKRCFQMRRNRKLGSTGGGALPEGWSCPTN